MPKIEYVPRTFTASSLELIAKSQDIIDEYEKQGYDLTLRQLYYQLVARDVIPNNLRSYKRLGSVINDARLAGLIDWERIQDLTRELRQVSHWEKPGDIIETAAAAFRLDKWANQRYRPEVWIEKDALRNVVERICTKLDVPYFSCRGYTSQSEMWVASQRLIGHVQNKQIPVILHLGDHDPSGIDMTRDVADRLQMFRLKLKVDRLALNMNQVDAYKPPPNPAKTTDSRYAGYIKRFGEESWELDALDPNTLSGIIEKAVTALRDPAAWNELARKEKQLRESLADCSNRWGDVAEFLAESK